MKVWKCDMCKDKRITADNIIIAICRSCVESMELIESRKGFVSEVKKEERAVGN